jgi:multisubunit Na+/H+ antiporter MnhC subunit
MLFFLLCFVLFSVGIYCAAAKQNVIKLMIGIILAEYAIVMLFIAFGYGPDGCDINARTAAGVVLCAGLAVTVMLTSIAMRVYDRFGTYDIKQIRKLKG